MLDEMGDQLKTAGTLCVIATALVLSGCSGTDGTESRRKIRGPVGTQPFGHTLPV